MLLHYSREEFPESDMSCDMSSFCSSILDGDNEDREGIEDEITGDNNWWLNDLTDRTYGAHATVTAQPGKKEHDPSYDSELTAASLHLHNRFQEIMVLSSRSGSVEVMAMPCSGIDTYQSF